MKDKVSKNQGGFVLALVALSLIPILLSTIFVFDIGRLLLTKQHLKIILDIGVRDGLEYLTQEMRVRKANNIGQEVNGVIVNSDTPLLKALTSTDQSAIQEKRSDIQKEIKKSIDRNFGILEKSQLNDSNPQIIYFPQPSNEPFNCTPGQRLGIQVSITYDQSFIFKKFIEFINTTTLSENGKIEVDNKITEINSSSLPFCP